MQSKWIVLALRDRTTRIHSNNYPNSLERDERLLRDRRDTVEIMMWVWAIGAFSVAAVVNQIAIALCWRAQDATESDIHEQSSP